jgi:uncharacterized membrane protein
MSDWNRIWRVLVPALLIVVVLVTAAGMVCHYHAHQYSADQCTLCHLVIAPTVANTGLCELTWASADIAVQPEFLIPGSVANHIPSRAPPA